VRVWPIFKKELRIFFTSPVAYVILAIFLLVMGWFFSQIFQYYAQATVRAGMSPMMGQPELNTTDGILRPLFSNIAVILLLSLMPLLTMRLFAEERRSGTIELLLTYPVRDGAVLLGKYLASLAFYAILLVLTWLYPLMLFYMGAHVEWGAVLTGYVGLFASSLTENQIVAAVTTFGILLMFWVIGWGADAAGGAWWGKVLQHLSITDHFESFGKGVFETKDIIYYLNFTILALFLALRSLEARRWKG
jgi:ABC-2 type transport system permease protein